MADQQVDIPTTIKTSGAGFATVLKGLAGASGIDNIDVNPFNPFVGLLDDYPSASAAYSLRKLDKDYNGSCVRIRRSSDNAEQDIGFVDNVLDEASLTSFVGANNGLVVRWYDQSGNANNAVQTAAGNQPALVTAGTINKVNNKPAIPFNGSDRYFALTSGITVTTPWSHFVAGKRNASGNHYVTISSTPGGNNYGLHWFNADNKFYTRGNEGFIVSTNADTGSSQFLYSVDFKVGAHKNYKNNVEIGSGLSAGVLADTFNSLGIRNVTICNGDMQECILWMSDQAANRSGIAGNINSFYSIY